METMIGIHARPCNNVQAIKSQLQVDDHTFIAYIDFDS